MAKTRRYYMHKVPLGRQVAATIENTPDGIPTNQISAGVSICLLAQFCACLNAPTLPYRQLKRKFVTVAWLSTGIFTHQALDIDFLALFNFFQQVGGEQLFVGLSCSLGPF